MTDHNDTGATARPSLTEMQLEILEECAGTRSPRLWGAAVGACLESLRGYGFIERNGKVTSAGATTIINAYEPLKARLAEVERERDDFKERLAMADASLVLETGAGINTHETMLRVSKRWCARAHAAEARVAVLEKALKRIADTKTDHVEEWRGYANTVREPLLEKADAILSLPRPAEPVEIKRPCEELYRHRKRGTTYRILHGDEYGTCFASSSSVAQIDHEPMVVYQDIADGRVWVRPRVEFFDGRFEKLPRTTKPTPEEVGEPVAWRLVPIEPTHEQLDAIVEECRAAWGVGNLPKPAPMMAKHEWRERAKPFYRAALKSAPHPPTSPDTSAAVLAERERCAAIADEWANKMALNYGRETANTIAAAIRQLPTESKP